MVEKIDDLTAYFRFVPIGIYDLNNDGFYEFCFNVGEWEGGHTVVLSTEGDGKYSVVMRSDWGT